MGKDFLKLILAEMLFGSISAALCIWLFVKPNTGSILAMMIGGGSAAFGMIVGGILVVLLMSK